MVFDTLSSLFTLVIFVGMFASHIRPVATSCNISICQETKDCIYLLECF